VARGCGNTELIRILLETGANVNAPPAEGDDRTSLQAASECGKIELVKILLEAGADVNAPPAEISLVTRIIDIRVRSPSTPDPLDLQGGQVTYNNSSLDLDSLPQRSSILMSALTNRRITYRVDRTHAIIRCLTEADKKASLGFGFCNSPSLAKEHALRSTIDDRMDFTF
jgi:ankyrin repeat protein